MVVEFDVVEGSELVAWLRENDFDVDDVCLLRCVVDVGGRSWVIINGLFAILI